VRECHFIGYDCQILMGQQGKANVCTTGHVSQVSQSLSNTYTVLQVKHQTERFCGIGPHFDGQQLKVLERTKNLVRQIKCLIKEHEIKQRARNMNDFYECNHPSKEYITRKLVTEFRSLVSKGGPRTTKEHQTNWNKGILNIQDSQTTMPLQMPIQGPRRLV
jgi:hypothetical protein